MSNRATVLYDAPGPVARRRNILYSVLAAALILALVGWVLWTLGNNGQLEADKWEPFLNLQTWTTYLLPGLMGTLQSALVSIVLAIVLGVILGLGRLAQNALIRWVCAVIVEFFRAIPVLLLMIFAYQLFAVYGFVPPRQLAFAAVVFALTMYNGAVIAEILRAGIKSLPKGQTEAAQALGLSHRQTQWTILLPQATASMLPALISQMVIALKDSALGYQIGYVEIVRSGIQSSSANQNYFASLIVVAIVMILINWGLSTLAERVERQLRAGRARRNIFAKVPEAANPGITTKDNAIVDWEAPGYQKIDNPGQ